MRRAWLIHLKASGAAKVNVRLVMQLTLPRLSLSSDDAFSILLRAREFDDGLASPDLDEPILFDEFEDEAMEAELAGSIGKLPDDALRDLIALILVGRGDFAPDEWDEARGAAAGVPRQAAPTYVTSMPLVSDFIEQGLSTFGHTLAHYVQTH